MPLWHRVGSGQRLEDDRLARSENQPAFFCRHMNPVMLAHLDEVRAAGALVAEDGAVIDL